jgi:hypothetical protein
MVCLECLIYDFKLLSLLEGSLGLVRAGHISTRHQALSAFHLPSCCDFFADMQGNILKGKPRTVDACTA